MRKKYFRGIRTGFERFRNFHAKPKGGPQASLALAKGGPQENFKKLKKCSKPFQTLNESSKTIFLMRKNIFEA